MGKASPCRAGRASLTHGGDPSLLVLTSKNFSRSFFIDVFPRADGHDFDVACSEPIDDSSSSHSQTPISLKLLFERLSTSWIFKNICQSRAYLAF